MAHPILYYCPSRTIIHLHICASAQLIVRLSAAPLCVFLPVCTVKTHECCHARRTPLRMVYGTCTAHTAAHCQVSPIPQGPSRSLKVRPRPHHSGRHNPARNTRLCAPALQHVSLSCSAFPALVFPWWLGYTSPSQPGAPVARPSSVSSCPFQLHAREPTWQAVRESSYMGNGYRTRNAAVHPGAGCNDQGHAGATASEWAPPIKCSVWRWAKCI